MAHVVPLMMCSRSSQCSWHAVNLNICVARLHATSLLIGEPIMGIHHIEL